MTAITLPEARPTRCCAWPCGLTECVLLGDAPELLEDELEPLAPAEPVVSAKATAGIDAIAAPTPRATASAPTRPT